MSKVDQTMLNALPTTPSKKIVGVKSSLLEKIRLKEQARTQLDSLESNGLIVNEQKRTENVDKLHYLRESVEILDQLFTTERQVALEFEKIRGKLVELHSAKFTSGFDERRTNFRLFFNEKLFFVFRTWRSNVWFRSRNDGTMFSWLFDANQTSK